MKSSSAKICSENVCHQAKLLAIFPRNFLLQKNLVSITSKILKTSLFRREIGNKISAMFKVKIERNKAGHPSPVLDLKLYNLTFNI